MPERANGTTRSTYGVVGVETAAIHARPDRLQREPGAHQAVAADAVGERAGDRRDEHRHRRPRQDAQPGLQRRVALHGLEELREQEDRAEHPEEHEQARRRSRARTCGCGRSASAASAARCAAPRATNARRARRADDERADDLGRRPADRVAAHEAPDDPEQAGAGEPEAGQVERGRPGRGSRRAGAARAERARARSARSARRSSATRCPTTTAPPTSGPNATARPLMPPQAPSARPRRSAGTAGREDGQRQRHHDRAAEALHGARGVERADRRRERSRRRGER